MVWENFKGIYFSVYTLCPTYSVYCKTLPQSRLYPFCITLSFYTELRSLYAISWEQKGEMLSNQKISAGSRRWCNALLSNNTGKWQTRPRHPCGTSLGSSVLANMEHHVNSEVMHPIQWHVSPSASADFYNLTAHTLCWSVIPPLIQVRPKILSSCNNLHTGCQALSEWSECFSFLTNQWEMPTMSWGPLLSSPQNLRMQPLSSVVAVNSSNIFAISVSDWFLQKLMHMPLESSSQKNVHSNQSVPSITESVNPINPITQQFSVMN